MTQLSYVQQTEVNNYGVAAIPMSTLMRASAMVDNILRFPHGLVWVPDANGWPCYMAKVSPSFSVTVASPSISPGVNLIVQLPPGSMLTDSIIGEVAVIDRLVPSATEAAVVRSFNAQAGTVTLATIQNAHSAPYVLDFGMTVAEERSLPTQRSITRLLETPIARVHSGAGRYGYGRRSDQMTGTYTDVNLLSMASAFAGPPAWQYFSVAASSFNQSSGEVWVPSGILLAYYTEVKFRYVSGWSLNDIPEAIKQATALLANAITQGQFPGNALRLKAGDHEIQRAVTTVLDVDTHRLLYAYRNTLMV